MRRGLETRPEQADRHGDELVVRQRVAGPARLDERGRQVVARLGFALVEQLFKKALQDTDLFVSSGELGWRKRPGFEHDEALRYRRDDGWKPVVIGIDPEHVAHHPERAVHRRMR